jgi:hypothetical protein
MPKLLCKAVRSAGREPIEVFLDAQLWAALEKERLTCEREYPEDIVSLAGAIRACLAQGLSKAQRCRDFARRREGAHYPAQPR